MKLNSLAERTSFQRAEQLKNRRKSARAGSTAGTSIQWGMLETEQGVWTDQGTRGVGNEVGGLGGSILNDFSTYMQLV